jgi:hypothetical protein
MSLAVTALGVTALSSVAVATTTPLYYVSHAPTVVGTGINCARPGFNNIQSAINAAEALSGGTVVVCPGSYRQQLQITGTKNITLSASNPGRPTVISMPATPADSTTPCDTASGTSSYPADQDLVALCGTTPITVSIFGLTINAAWPSGTCYDSEYGVLVGGGDTVIMRFDKLTAGGAVPINGCQGGIALQLGMSWTTPNEIGLGNIFHVAISGYQKGGAQVDGNGSRATFTADVVTGAGATTLADQTGIQVSNGAYGKISHSTITGNECNSVGCGPEIETQSYATGVLFHGAAPGSSVIDSKIQGNDIGVYYFSEKATLPTSPDVTLDLGSIGGNRFENVVADQGDIGINAVSISGGRIGLLLRQYNGQSYGPHVVATGDRLFGSSVAAVDVLSDLASSGDLPGSLVLTSCKVHGSVISNSTSVSITTN